MKRAFAIAAVVDLIFLALALYTSIKDFLFVHSWLLSALAAAPALVIAFLELRHSGEANELRVQANNSRDEANAQSKEANSQRERVNEALAQIAAHTDAMRRNTDLQTIGLHQWVHLENWKAVPYIPEGGALSLHIQFDVVNSTDLPLTLNNVSVMFACHGCSDQWGKIGRMNLVLPGKSHPVVTSVKITEEQALKWEDLKELVYIVNMSVEFEDALKEVRNQPYGGLDSMFQERWSSVHSPLRLWTVHHGRREEERRSKLGIIGHEFTGRSVCWTVAKASLKCIGFKPLERLGPRVRHR